MMSILARNSVLIGSMLIAVFYSGSSGFAAERTWRNPEGGEFLAPGNWQEGLTPGLHETALFNLADETYRVEFDADVTNDRLLVHHGEVTLDLNGNTYRLTYEVVGPENALPNSNRSVIVGDAGGDDGTLTVIGGTLESVGGRVGNHSSAHGSVRISGPAATWANSGGLIVGVAGQGEVTIEDGGELISGYGSIGHQLRSGGRVTVTDPGSAWTNTGQLNIRGGYGFGSNDPAGLLTIKNGGKMSNTDGVIGGVRSIGGQPAVVVTGAGSVWENSGNLRLGATSRSGPATLTIRDGGAVDNAWGYIGAWSGSQGVVTVSGEGATWTNRDRLQVGSVGTGTLHISEGGRVQSREGTVGNDSGSVGLVTVSGVGSTWRNSSRLEVGRFGEGTLRIQDGGRVTSGQGRIGSDGKVTVTDAGSVWTSTSYMEVRGGTLAVENGGRVIIDAWGQIRHDSEEPGRITVTGAGSSLSSRSWLDIHAGTLTIADGGSVSSSRSHIGTGQGSSGTVTVTGAGARWTHGGLVIAEGTLLVEEGGHVTSTSAHIGDFGWQTHGNVTVRGDGSAWIVRHGLMLGSQTLSPTRGTGSLTISSGGEVKVIGNTRVADANDNWIHFDGGKLTTDSLLASPDQLRGTGTINTRGLVSDMDLVFEQPGQLQQQLSLTDLPDQNLTIHLNVDGGGDLGAGYRGAGSLRIANGQRVVSDHGRLGEHAGATGEATVQGANSHWAMDGNFSAGLDGTGTLTVRNGGSVSNHTAVIGNRTEASGSVTVAGAGSNWTSRGSLFVGYWGSGAVTVEEGGHVTTEFAYIGFEGEGEGVVTVAGVGSTWISHRSVYIGGHEGVVGGTGLFEVSDGGHAHIAETLHVWTGGTLAGDSTVMAAAVDNSGIISPGTFERTGLLKLEADYIQQSHGQLRIRIAGSSSHDSLFIGGDVSLDGTLDLVVLDDYQPTLGDVFTLLNWTGDLTGEFATIRTSDLGEGYAWNFDDLYMDGTVRIVPEPSTFVVVSLNGIWLLARRRRRPVH